MPDESSLETDESSHVINRCTIKDDKNDNKLAIISEDVKQKCIRMTSVFFHMLGILFILEALELNEVTEINKKTSNSPVLVQKIKYFFDILAENEKFGIVAVIFLVICCILVYAFDSLYRGNILIVPLPYIILTCFIVTTSFIYNFIEKYLGITGNQQRNNLIFSFLILAIPLAVVGFFLIIDQKSKKDSFMHSISFLVISGFLYLMKELQSHLYNKDLAEKFIMISSVFMIVFITLSDYSDYYMLFKPQARRRRRRRRQREAAAVSLD